MDLKRELKAFFVWILSILPLPHESLGSYVRRFVADQRAEEDYSAPVMIIIAGIIWVICIPIYVDEVQNTNTSGWSFTGYAGATTLFLLMPFVFIAGGLVWILKKVLK